MEPQSWTMKYWNLMNAGSVRNNISQRRTQQLAIHYYLVSPENVLTNSITWTEQFVFMYLRITIYFHPYLTMICERRGINLKVSKEEYMEDFGRRKGKEELMLLYCNIKNKGNNIIFGVKSIFMS